MIQKATLANGQPITVQTSGPFQLVSADFIKALIVAVIAAVLGAIEQAVSDGTLFAPGSLKVIGLAAVGGFVSYLLKNFFSTTSRVVKIPE